MLARMMISVSGSTAPDGQVHQRFIRVHGCFLGWTCFEGSRLMWRDAPGDNFKRRFLADDHPRFSESDQRASRPSLRGERTVSATSSMRAVSAFHLLQELPGTHPPRSL